FDAHVPPAPKGKPGRKAQKGPRLPSPKQAAAKADRKRTAAGEWLWQEVRVTAYGETRRLRVLAYGALGRRVLGLRPVRVAVAPWVWSLHSLLMVWYLTAGRELPEAEELREVMGEWDSEWSLRHMVAVLRRATLNAAIEPMSGEPDELLKLIEALKNCVNLAA